MSVGTRDRERQHRAVQGADAQQQGEAREPLRERLTDLGNARILVYVFGHRLRHLPERKKWLVWDGRRWRADSTGQVMRDAKKTIRLLYGLAARTDDDGRRDALLRHARDSEKATRLKAMIELAQSEKRVVLRPDQLDCDPWVLNCLNGTLDLKTGRLRPHRPSDLITKLAPAEFVPGARDEHWDSFLARVQPAEEQRAFLQRAVGYTLTGDTSEEVLFFPQGGTSTGKSTFVEAIRAMIGGYAVSTPFGSLLRRKNESSVRNDIARLDGTRLVTASEVSAGQQFDDALLKQLTGRDTVTARFLHQEFFDFLPQCTLWIAANHRPRVRGDDSAIWRRLLLLPFTETIPKEDVDKNLKTYLRSAPQARSAILTWAVEGCLAWQREGLRVPESVKVATEGYRAEQDTFAEFIAEFFMEDPELWTPFEIIRMTYDLWCQTYGERYPLGQKGLTEALRQRGYAPEKRAGKRGWRGLAPLGKPIAVDTSDSKDSCSEKSLMKDQ